MDHFIGTPQQLAQTLRSRRKALNLTQKEAAGLVGLLPKTVSALETNPDRCSLKSLRHLLAALRLELALSPKSDGEAMERSAEW
jgi:HTH-type transcriptional regulator/antitoxin HipB